MDAIFTTELLAEIGDALRPLRPSSCVVKRSTAKDAEGAPTGANPSTIATVRCRVDPPSRRVVEGVFGPRQTTEADAVLYLDLGPTVLFRDTIATTINGVATDFSVVDVAIDSQAAEITVLCTRSA